MTDNTTRVVPKFPFRLPQLPQRILARRTSHDASNNAATTDTSTLEIPEISRLSPLQTPSLTTVAGPSIPILRHSPSQDQIDVYYTPAVSRTTSNVEPYAKGPQVSTAPVTSPQDENGTSKGSIKTRLRQIISSESTSDQDSDYTLTKWSTSKATFRALPYTFKVRFFQFLYGIVPATLAVLQAPEYLILWNRDRKRQKLANRPATSAAPSRRNRTLAERKRVEKQCLLVMFSIAILFNIGYAVWTALVSAYYTHPHKYRSQPYVSGKSKNYNWAGSLPWVGGAMVPVNFCLFFLFMAIYHAFFGPSSGRYSRRHNGWCGFICSMGFIFCLWMAFWTAWPITFAYVGPMLARLHAYPHECLDGKWDYHVELHGRIDAHNLTKGRITITDLRTYYQPQLVYETSDYVNITTRRNAEPVTLVFISAGAGFVPTPLVNKLDMIFPYLSTVPEQKNWASVGDVIRDHNGNYTAYLNSTLRYNGPVTLYNGSFPYVDETIGLRLDDLGLLPDAVRTWRARVDPSLCVDGPDTLLYEHTDPSSRILATANTPSNASSTDPNAGSPIQPSDRHIIVKTGMTKYRGCYKMNVCANRRTQELTGSRYADGVMGRELLDHLLIVPLGLLLIEQMKWASCCGDGWTEYKTAVSYGG